LAITRFIFGGVMERLPALRICFAHGGGAFVYILGRVHHGWTIRDEPKEFISNPPIDYARKLYFDSLTHSPENLRYLIEALGHDKIVIGTDYPFAMGEADPVAFLETCDLEPAVIAAIEGTNALAFLGRDAG